MDRIPDGVIHTYTTGDTRRHTVPQQFDGDDSRSRDESAQEDISASIGNPVRLIGLSEVCRRVSLSRSTIYRQLNAGGFPQPVEVGVNRKAWVESEIDWWIAAKIHRRDMESGK